MDNYKREDEFSYDGLVEYIYPQLTENEKNDMDEIINFHTEEEFLRIYRRVALRSCILEEFDEDLFWEELDVFSSEGVLRKLRDYMDEYVRPEFGVGSDNAVARFFVLVLDSTNFLEEHYEEIELDDTIISNIHWKLSPMQSTYLLDYLDKGSLEPYSDAEKVFFLNDAIKNAKKYAEAFKRDLLI